MIDASGFLPRADQGGNSVAKILSQIGVGENRECPL
ncbi:hypothetical protein HG66A1_55850 [Gimesia chilikensis]|uniref:Uncharacterized protein n=1 Tax=Gimesia chilikensis TaxID=2605989 RepID=A0A517PWK6_9PLAN|nr:hypothetical protein HG66A1_55850 [Gimesia chilikensis]QDT87569.1 hypothetical protein MalM14_52560 [Gimesia chilikensis]